jgi:drug/metabolite transporter (DMT)-like permease
MNKYTLGLLGTTLAWGLAFTLIKQGAGLVGIWPFFAARFFFGALILLLVFRGKILAFDLDRIRSALILGVLLFLHLWLQAIGIEMTSASRAGFITSLYVPMTPFLMWSFTGRPPKRLHLGLVALAFCGLILMSLPKGVPLDQWFAQSNPGDWYTAVAALVAAFHIVATGILAPRDSNPVALGFWQFLFVFLIFTITTVFKGEAQALAIWNWPQVAWVSMGLCAVLATAFGFTMQIICQRHVPAVRAAIIFGLEAPAALLFGVAMMGDHMSGREIAGAFLLFLASVIPDKSGG